MITIALDTAKEEQDLEFQAATEDKEEAWAEASVALSAEVFPVENWAPILVTFAISSTQAAC
ncbi:MAG: hypothetical protein ABSE73_29860 [Planctomycetota bacterium]